MVKKTKQVVGLAQTFLTEKDQLDCLVQLMEMCQVGSLLLDRLHPHSSLKLTSLNKEPTRPDSSRGHSCTRQSLSSDQKRRPMARTLGFVFK